MTSASAWLDGDVATDDEKADGADLLAWSEANRFKFGKELPPAPKRRTTTGTLHMWGEHKGELFVSTPHMTLAGKDFGEASIEALRSLLAQDSRVAAGHYYSIQITP